MSESPHRIRRERWVVRTGSQEEAFEIRRLLNDGWQDVSPVFEKAFDAINVGTNVVRIPKLEIHLTVDSVEQLATALPDLILERLRHELRSIEVPPSRESSQRHFSKKITENEDRLEALVTYLRTGALPWRLKSTDSAAVSRMLAQTASGERARLRGRLLDLDARDSMNGRWCRKQSLRASVQVSARR